MSIAESRDKFQRPRSIYEALVEYQRSAEWWPHREELEWLRDWGELFIKQFAIKIKDGQYLPMPLIKIEPVNRRVTLSYRRGPDGYGLAGTILVNEKRLDMPDATKLALLLMVLWHAWRQQRCPDEVFVRECQERFKTVGLAFTTTGITIERGGRFEQLLRRHEIDIPAHEIEVASPKVEPTKDRLWSCRCRKIRSSDDGVGMQCLRCQEFFSPGYHVARGAAGRGGPDAG